MNHKMHAVDPDMTERSCPSCQAVHFVAVVDVQDHFGAGVYPVVRCESCRLLYLRVAPSTDRIGAHYRNFAGSNMVSAPSRIFGSLRRVAYGLEYKSLATALTREDPIVDLGTGDGSLARYFAQRGKSVTACDVFDAEDWPYAEIPYRQIDLNRMDGSAVRGAKAVVMRHVLEHVHAPAELLRLFAREGVRYVHVLVPNASSPFVTLFGEDWFLWDPPRHLQFFQPATLDGVAARAGYRHVDASDHGIDEVVVSLFRRRMLRWQRSMSLTSKPSPESEWWFRLYSPKGLLCTASAALSGFVVKSVLSRLYRLDDAGDY